MLIKTDKTDHFTTAFLHKLTNNVLETVTPDIWTEAWLKRQDRTKNDAHDLKICCVRQHFF